MYLRKAFTITDRETALNLIRDTGWGRIFGLKDDLPISSHLPFVVVGEQGREWRLVGRLYS